MNDFKQMKNNKKTNKKVSDVSLPNSVGSMPINSLSPKVLFFEIKR